MARLDGAPVLTLPDHEAGVLSRACDVASVVLEYGSGGSTVLAADRTDRVMSVESDADWLDTMRAWFAAHKPRAEVVLHHADIGPTGKWGMPAGVRSFRSFPGYALDIWDHPGFSHPDLVLIDGRFRPACLLATAFRIARPVTVLFDDYADRPAYHGVEAMFRPVALHGRMAEFHLKPTVLPAAQLAWIMGWFLKPQ